MDTAANIAVMAKILVFFNLDINIPPLQYLPFYYIGGHLTCVAAGCDKETARTTFRPDDNSPFIEHLTPLCLLCICLAQIIIHVIKKCNKNRREIPVYRISQRTCILRSKPVDVHMQDMPMELLQLQQHNRSYYISIILYDLS